MATIKAKDLKGAREEIVIQILGYEAKLAGVLDKDSDEAVRLRLTLSDLRDKIDEFDKELEIQEVKEERAQKRSNWKKDQPLVDKAIDENYFGYIIPEDKFIFCRDYGVSQSNTQFKLFPATRIVRMLSKLIGSNIASKDYNEIIDYFQHRNRTFTDITSSFNRDKWNEGEIYNKMSVIRDKWLHPDLDTSDDYDKRLDILISCVCGGKQENIDHLEQWVAFKYLNPDKNSNTPNLDLGGTPGGNGKGRFIELLKTIFTNTCVIQAHKEELDKFNSNWEMAVILYYDEPEEKELAAAKLKQATGSEDMRIEKKGIDATMADRNYNFVFMSNNEKGVVKLSGGSNGGEDRRYSVINTDLVLLDVFMDIGYTEEESLDAVNDLAQKLVKDRVQVAKWLGHIIKKHNIIDVPVMSALHGEDYMSRFDSQKDATTHAFDKILPTLKEQGMIPQSILGDMVRAITENATHKDINVMSKFKDYLKRNKVDFKTHDRFKYKLMWQNTLHKEMQGKVIYTGANPTKEFEYSKVSTKKMLELDGQTTLNSNTIALIMH